MIFLLMSMMFPQVGHAFDGGAVDKGTAAAETAVAETAVAEIVQEFKTQAIAFIADHHNLFFSRRVVSKRFNRLQIVLAESPVSKRLKRHGYDFRLTDGQTTVVIDPGSWNEGAMARLSIVTNVVRALDPEEPSPTYLEIMEEQERMLQDLESSMQGT